MFMASQTHNYYCNALVKFAKMRITAQEVISPVVGEVAQMAARAVSVVAEVAEVV